MAGWCAQCDWAGVRALRGGGRERLLGQLGDSCCHHCLVPVPWLSSWLRRSECLSQRWKRVWSVRGCASVSHGRALCVGTQEGSAGTLRDGVSVRVRERLAGVCPATPPTASLKGSACSGRGAPGSPLRPLREGQAGRRGKPGRALRDRRSLGRTSGQQTRKVGGQRSGGRCEAPGTRGSLGASARELRRRPLLALPPRR